MILKLIKLKCDNCGADLEVDKEQGEIICKYCGTKILINDEESELKRIEDVKLKARKEHHEQLLKEKRDLDEIEDYRKFKNGIFSKFVVVFTFICLLYVIASFRNGLIVSGVIGIVQIACLSLGWLFGMRIIKKRVKNIHMALIIIGFALMIPIIVIAGNDDSDVLIECEDIDWEHINLKDHLPEYENPVGDLFINSDFSLNVTLCKVDKEEYKSYLNQTRELGYTIDSIEYGTSYYASSSDGYDISLSWDEEKKEMSISLETKYRE